MFNKCVKFTGRFRPNPQAVTVVEAPVHMAVAHILCVFTTAGRTFVQPAYGADALEVKETEREILVAMGWL